MTQHQEDLYLRHKLESAEKAEQFSTGISRAAFDPDEVLRLALLHLIQMIGEAARGVSAEFQGNHPEIPWKVITGMRHRIMHGYADVDEDVVWATIHEDLLPLIASLKMVLGE